MSTSQQHTNKTSLTILRQQTKLEEKKCVDTLSTSNTNESQNDLVTNLQVLCYFVCVWFFFIGTIFLAPSVKNLTLGGWLFFPGSIGFCALDAGELWKLYMMPPPGSADERATAPIIAAAQEVEDYQHPIERVSFASRQLSSASSVRPTVSSAIVTTLTSTKQVADKLNIPLLDSKPAVDPLASSKLMMQVSFFGSLMYFFGSILFIPSNTLVVAISFFTIGSFLFVGLSLIRLYQLGCCEVVEKEAKTNTGQDQDPLSKQTKSKAFKFKNLWNDVLSVLIDVNGGLASAMFFIGGFLYLPRFSSNPVMVWSAWVLFQVGSAGYCFTGGVILYKLILFRRSRAAAAAAKNVEVVDSHSRV